LNTLEAIGWVGSFLLAFCGLPQCIKSWREKNSDGISLGFILSWTIGEVLLLFYVLPKNDIVLIMNYTINIFFCAVILFYKWKPGVNKKCIK
jgi:MtN3 and saliva related transmembrane protein